MSGKVTVPGSPREEQDVFAMHIKSYVSKSRDHMKEFMQNCSCKVKQTAQALAAVRVAACGPRAEFDCSLLQ